MTDLVERLVANPGLYTGPQADPADPDGPKSVARITVTPLPGGAGVSMAYEVLSAENGVVHQEHSVLARTPRGVVLVTAHTHADVAAVLFETEPGMFPAGDGDSPFPMAIRLEAPEPGHLIYSWSYGRPGEPLVVRDVGTVRVST
jgi:hypothetical protein